MNDNDFAEGDDKEFLLFILKKLVEYPDDIRIDRTVDEMGVLLTVQVNPEDMGKVVGKGGQTAKAMRTLLRIIGSKTKANINMKISDPEDKA